MNRILRVAMGLVAAFASIGADSGDQVIMRRVIGSPATGGEVPIPITYFKVPTQVSTTADAVPAANGTLSVSTAISGVQCSSKRLGLVDPKFCENVADSLPVGTFQLPARVSRALRMVVVDPSQIRSIASVANVDQFCSSSATLDGSVWGISCDPSIFDHQFVKVPTIASPIAGSFPLADGNISFDTASSGVVCRQVSTGDLVDMSECAGSPTPATVGTVKVAAKGESGLRTIAFSLGSLQAIVPSITNGDALCAGSIAINGQSWKLRCDQDSLRVHYKRQATHVEFTSKSLGAPAVAQPNIVDSIGVDTSKNAQCIDTDTGRPAADASSCAFLPADPAVGTFQIPATFSPQLHTVLVDPKAVTSVAPTVSDAQDLCTANVAVSYPSSNQSWKATCSPEDVRVHYAKVPTMALPQSFYGSSASSNFDGSLAFSTDGAGVLCVDTDTQQNVDASKCAYVTAANVGTLQASATFSPQLRTIWFDSAALKAQVPAIANLDALCGGTSVVYYPSDQLSSAQSWKLTCDKNDVRLHYAKGATFLTPNVYQSSIVGSTSSGVANFTDTMTFSSAAQGTTCTDTDTNQLVDVSKCAYVTSPSVSASIPVSASFAPTYRKAYIAKSALQALLPTATNIDALCAGGAFSFGLKSSGASEAWSLTCDSSDMSLHYRKIPTTISAVILGADANNPYYQASGTSGAANASGSFYASTAASGVLCRDTDTATMVSTSYCAYAVTPSNVSGNLRISSATFSPMYRKILVSRSEAAALLPDVTNLDALCSGMQVVLQFRYGGSETWTTTCNADDVRTHYVKVPTFVNASSVTMSESNATGWYWVNTGTSAGYGNDTMTWFVNTASQGVICRDTDTGSSVSATNCAYAPNPSNLSAALSVGSITLSPTYRKVLINRSALQALVPEATNLDALCGQAVTVSSRYFSEAWTYTCNPDDVRPHYVKVPTYLSLVPLTSYSGTGSNPWWYNSTGSIGQGNQDVATFVDTASQGVICRDTDTGSTVSASACAYVASPSNLGTKVVGGTFTYSPFYRKILVDRASLAKVVPEATDLDAICAGVNVNVGFYSTGETWTTTCNADDVRVHYAKIPTFISPVTVSGSGINPWWYNSNGSVGQSNASIRTSANTASQGVICRDTDTGATVSGSICVYAANPSNLSTSLSLGSLTYSPLYRKVYVPRASLTSLVPEASNVDAICAGQSLQLAFYSLSETWTFTCNADDVRVHYAKVATNPVMKSSLTLSAAKGSTDNSSSSVGMANFTGQIWLDSASQGVICRDTDTGNAVSASACVYAATPSTISSSYLVKGTYAPIYRKFYLDRSALATQLPDATSASLDAICSSQFSMSFYGGGNETWSTTCNADDVRSHYAKIATSPTLPSSESWSTAYGSTNNSGNSIGASQFNGGINLDTLSQGVICRDTDTGSSVSATYCAYAATPSNISSSYRVSASYSSLYRRILIDRSSLSSALPNATSSSLDAVCGGQLTMSFYGGGSETWTTTCNSADMREHYAKVAAHITSRSNSAIYSAYGNRTSSSGLANVTANYLVDTASSGVGCLDTDTKTLVSGSNCVYAPTPSTISTGATLGSAVFSPLYRKAYISRDAIVAAFPYLDNVDAFCGGMSFDAYIGTAPTVEKWTTTCVADNVRVHYTSVATSLTVNNAPQVVQSGTGNATILLGVGSVSCLDTDTKTTADAAYCSYAAALGTVNPTGTYNGYKNTITIPSSTLTTTFPYADQSSICGKPIGVYVGNTSTTYTAANSGWTLLCS